MAQEKISFEQFMEAVETDNKSFVQGLHSYLLDNGCKVTFEEKKAVISLHINTESHRKQL